MCCHCHCKILTLTKLSPIAPDHRSNMRDFLFCRPVYLFAHSSSIVSHFVSEWFCFSCTSRNFDIRYAPPSFQQPRNNNMCNKIRQIVRRTQVASKSLRVCIIGGIKYIGACHDIFPVSTSTNQKANKTDPTSDAHSSQVPTHNWWCPLYAFCCIPCVCSAGSWPKLHTRAHTPLILLQVSISFEFTCQMSNWPASNERKKKNSLRM